MKVQKIRLSPHQYSWLVLDNHHLPIEPTEKNRNPYWQNQKFNLKQCLENHGYEPILFQVNFSRYPVNDINFEGLSMHLVRIHHQDAPQAQAGHLGFVYRTRQKAAHLTG